MNGYSDTGRWKLITRIGAVLAIIVAVISIYQFATSQINYYSNLQATATANTIAANPYPSYLPGIGTIVLYNSLPSKTWDNLINTDGSSCQFTNGTYQVILPESAAGFGCAISDSEFGNFALEVQMRITAGGCGDIGFGSTVGGNYDFKLCQDGTYHLLGYRGVHLGLEDLIPSQISTAFYHEPNQFNLIAIVANGSTLSVYINKQQIGSATDTTYGAGGIYLSAIQADTSAVYTQVEYKEVKVWTL